MSAVYTDRDHTADGYLTKPFDLALLLSQVRQLLGEV